MNRRDALKTVVASAFAPMLPLSSVEANEKKLPFYGIVNGKRVELKDLKIGDVVEIFNEFDKNLSIVLKMTSYPMCKESDGSWMWVLSGEDSIYENVDIRVEMNETHIHWSKSLRRFEPSRVFASKVGQGLQKDSMGFFAAYNNKSFLWNKS